MQIILLPLKYCILNSNFAYAINKMYNHCIHGNKCTFETIHLTESAKQMNVEPLI